uniref:Carbohydrate sulfotransferase n=1 Tax=Knipowitschia caucasica TaxID=637954 RepID=A0AAV2K1M5_KNICA
MAKLKHYTKFIFVRDPLVRLISAYKNKFLEDNDAYYQVYGIRILKHFSNMSHPSKVNEAGKSRVYPSFQQFLEFITDPDILRTHRLDVHWRPQHQLCLPCTIKYDFVGHQETLQEDADLLLKMLNIDIAFPHSPSIPNNADSVKVWFKSVPKATMRKLYKMYELDFKLFGYPQPPLDDLAAP